MKFPARFAKASAVFGTAVALGSVLMFVGAPAVQASANEPTTTAATNTVANPTAQETQAIVVQPDGTTAEVPPETVLDTDTDSAYVPPFYVREYQFSTLANCDRRWVLCLWSENHFDGWFFMMGGTYAPCEGWRFEGSFMQDHVYSIWNRVTGGPISIWNRYSDGSFNYHKFALLQPGYSHDTEFSHIMDAWVYDPNNNCTRLKLHVANFTD